MNKEYIERDAALKAMSQAIQDRTWSMDDFDVMIKMEDYVTDLPAADVTPIRKSTEEEKIKFKSLFAKKEKYYALSTIYDLAFEDDVNGTCDGRVDAWLIATLTSKDVAPVVHGHWYDEDSVDAHGTPIYRCSVCNRTVADNYISFHKFCLHCGTCMDEGD